MIAYIRLFVAFLLTVFPYGGDYAKSFLGSIIGVIALTGCYRLPTEAIKMVLGVVAIFYMPVLIMQLGRLEYVWELRQLAYVLLAAFFLLSIPSQYLVSENRKLFKFLNYLCVFLIFIDFLVLNIDYFGVSAVIMGYIVNNNFQNYIDGYYRYLGVLGNPNHSGLFYALLIIFIGSSSLLPRILKFIACSIAGYLLIATFSRTAFIALLIGLIVSIKSKKLFVVFILMLPIAIYLLPEYLVDMLLSRVNDLSAASERGEILRDNLSIISILDHFFGSPKIPEVTDNDFLSIYLRFGFFGLLGYLLILLYVVYMHVRFGTLSSLKLGVFFVILVSGLAGGALGNPQLMYVAFLFCLFDHKLTQYQFAREGLQKSAQ